MPRTGDENPNSTQSGNGRSQRVRIRDVAEAAGAAQSTVSNALNGTGSVDPGTRERILKVASELGYVPNRNARSLRTDRAGMLGIMLSTRSEAGEVANVAYNLRLAGGASRAAFRRHNALTLLPPVRTPEEAGLLVPDGVILADIEVDDPARAAFDEIGVPIVTIEADPGSPDEAYWVGADTPTNTRTGLDHLMATGATTIAYIGTDATGTWSVQSAEAYHHWCRERGLEPVAVTVPRTQTVRECAEALGRLLQRDPRPDAIFALTEKIAVSVVQRLGELDISVPHELRVLSGSDGDHAAQALPPITAIDLHPEEVGAAAVALLYERIEGLDTERPRIIRATLNARESTTGRL